MKILHTESSMHWGGQEFRTLLEHNYLNNHHHESWLMCHPESVLYQKATSLGAKNIVALNLTRTWRLDIALRIANFCRSKKIDLINSHSTRDSVLCLIAYVLGTPLIRSRQITNTIKKTFAYKRGCSHIIAAAYIIKEMLINVGVDQHKITVIGEGVDLQEFNPSIDSTYLKSEFGLQDDDKVITNIGMIRADKGQKFFLDAAISILKLRSDVKFFLVGEATAASKTYASELAETIQQHNIERNFIVTGYRNDVAAFIHLSDAVVVASIGTEAQSRIVPQSFASSRTVVTTNVGGLTELVQNEINGLVVSPEDSTAMSAAILRLLDDKALKHRLETAAYVMAIDQLSFEQMMNKTTKLYSQLTIKRSFIPNLQVLP